MNSDDLADRAGLKGQGELGPLGAERQVCSAEKSTFFLRGNRLGAYFVLALGLLAVSWPVYPRDYVPHSVTTVGISEPGKGPGINNGLRAKSIPATAEISRLEYGVSARREFSLRETDLFQ